MTITHQLHGRTINAITQPADGLAGFVLDNGDHLTFRLAELENPATRAAIDAALLFSSRGFVVRQALARLVGR